jgi:hypothetical protein
MQAEQQIPDCYDQYAAQAGTQPQAQSPDTGRGERNTTQSKQATEQGRDRRNPQQKFYANKAAMCVERAHVEKDGVTSPHLMIEMAPANNKVADWKSKVILQLSTEECAQLAACLLGYMPVVKFDRPAKGIHFERQKGNLFVRASEKKSDRQVVCPMPLNPDAVFMLSGFVLGHLQTVWKGGGDALVPALRGAFALMSH